MATVAAFEAFASRCRVVEWFWPEPIPWTPPHRDLSDHGLVVTIQLEQVVDLQIVVVANLLLVVVKVVLWT